MDKLITAFIVLVISGLICLFLQKISPSIPGQKFWRKDSKTDLVYWLFATLVNIYLVMLSISIFLIITTTLFPHSNSLDVANNETNVLDIFISLVTIDFIAYWIHRIFHRNRLWKFHAIHHSSKDIDWLSSMRFHPLETIVIATFAFVILFGLGFSLKTVGIAYFIRGTYGFIVHSNLSWHYGPFGYIIASPYFHRWHHTKQKEALDKNFGGAFSVWDFIFGTAYFPKNKQPSNFGVSQDVGSSFFKQIIYPFRNK